jgi:hypothetical protein
VKTKEILQKAEAAMNPLTELAGIFGVMVPPQIGIAIGIINGIVDHFSKADPEQEWTQDEIDAAANEAIQGIHDRTPHFVRDEVEEPQDVEDE